MKFDETPQQQKSSGIKAQCEDGCSVGNLGAYVRILFSDACVGQVSVQKRSDFTYTSL